METQRDSWRLTETHGGSERLRNLAKFRKLVKWQGQDLNSELRDPRANTSVIPHPWPLAGGLASEVGGHVPQGRSVVSGDVSKMRHR